MRTIVGPGRLGYGVAASFGALVLALVVAMTLAAAGAQATPAVAVSPLNGTPDASPESQISFLGVPANEISDISVVGSRSGGHSGKLESYASSPGASFLPARPFAQGERSQPAPPSGRRATPRA